MIKQLYNAFQLIKQLRRKLSDTAAQLRETVEELEQADAIITKQRMSHNQLAHSHEQVQNNLAIALGMIEQLQDENTALKAMLDEAQQSPI